MLSIHANDMYMRDCITVYETMHIHCINYVIITIVYICICYVLFYHSCGLIKFHCNSKEQCVAHYNIH